MTPSSDRACPSCSAPARDDQHWCLECGAELPAPRGRRGRRPAIGIATTLVVLVGAASAGGYSLMQDGAKPPPPPTTVAQEAPPPVETTPEPTEPLPEPLPAPGDDDALPDDGADDDWVDDWEDDDDWVDDGDDWVDDDDTGGGDTGSGGGAPSGGGGETGSGGDGGSTDRGGGGAVEDDRDGGGAARPRRPAKPRLVETNVALGAVAVTYPPLADGQSSDDPSAVVDGSPRTAWRTPTYEDPAAVPQLGVYVDLASPERLTRMIVSSPTPGARVEIYAARTGPPRTVTAAGWDHVADATLRARTRIDLPARARYRYVLVWVTGLPPDGDHVAISGIDIRSMQPE